MKMNMVNERPHLRRDQQWSETGNRYVLKLFRDYVFHQDTDDGNPSTDLGHVIDSLNKLDIGSEEKILLMARDNKSILVVKYADIKKVR